MGTENPWSLFSGDCAVVVLFGQGALAGGPVGGVVFDTAQRAGCCFSCATIGISFMITSIKVRPVEFSAHKSPLHHLF